MITKLTSHIAIVAAALLIVTGAANADSMSNSSDGRNSMNMANGMDRYGGPIYRKSTDLPTTNAFIEAGGGAGNFSAAAALTSLLGKATTDAEIDKLNAQYGQPAVKSFIDVFNFAVNDAAKIATASGVTFPAPALSGHKLAMQLVNDGTVNGTFWTGYLLDHLVTHKIHDQVMSDIDTQFGPAADANYHKISNQAMYDIAQALGDKRVMLAALH